jgi:hypothetical protein
MSLDGERSHGSFVATLAGEVSKSRRRGYARLRVMPRCKTAPGAFHRDSDKDATMIRVTRSILLAAGLLAVPVAGGMAQQNNAPNGGAALKSITPGDPGGARSASAMASNLSGRSLLKTGTMGDTGKKVIPETGSKTPAGRSTGPTRKQPQ